MHKLFIIISQIRYKIGFNPKPSIGVGKILKKGFESDISNII